MPDLALLQSRFAAALVEATQARPLLSELAGTPETALRRLAIYRGNLHANRAQALANAFPVVAKIVGEEFFDGLAREYGRRHPSTSGDLNEYGERFAAFLAGFAPAQELPYLTHVARLEWCVHRAHYAADHAPLESSRLAALPEARQATLRLALNPAAAMLASDYPIARIWEIHRPEYGGEFTVDLTPAHHFALVYRPEYTVRVAAISAGEFAFLHASGEGEQLGPALDAALAADSKFDLGSALVRWIGDNVIAGWSI